MSSVTVSLLEELRGARRPEDIFGTAGDSPVEVRRGARARYRLLARQLHPDRNTDPGAAEAFKLLGALWQEAQRLFADGSYGPDRSPTVTVRAGGREWQLGQRVASGEVCDTFEGVEGTRRVWFKVARRPGDGDLVRAEAATLRHLSSILDPAARPFIPRMLDSVAVRQPGGIVRQANVVASLGGFRPLTDVLDAYPGGIDPRDMAWIWRRLLYVLEAANGAGVVHGLVVPTAVLIHPELHGLVLADWEGSVRVGDRPKLTSRRFPGAKEREPTTASYDIDEAALTVMRLIDYRNTPAPLRAHFRACLLSQARRPTAAQLREPFDDLLERTYGPRRFRPFHLPERR